MKVGDYIQYIIEGDTDDFNNCMVMTCGDTYEKAQEVLNRLLVNPNENDKRIIKMHKNLRIESVEDEKAWWLGNCD